MADIDFKELAVFRLSAYAHQSPEGGLCAMEAVAWLEGLEHTDRPDCTCPVVAEFVRTFNDGADDDNRQRLVEYLPRLVGTVSEPHERDRAAWLADMVSGHMPVDNYYLDCMREELASGGRETAAFFAARAVFGGKKNATANSDYGFEILDGLLAIGPQSPGFSTDVPERVKAYREFTAA